MNLGVKKKRKLLEPKKEKDIKEEKVGDELKKEMNLIVVLDIINAHI